MKPYQKAILIVLLSLALIKAIPQAYGLIKGKPPVRRGQIWQIGTKVLSFRDNIEVDNQLVISRFLILSVDDDNNVKAWCRGDTVDMRVSDFTFQSEGWMTSLVQDSDQ